MIWASASPAANDRRPAQEGWGAAGPRGASLPEIKDWCGVWGSRGASGLALEGIGVGALCLKCHSSEATQRAAVDGAYIPIVCGTSIELSGGPQAALALFSVFYLLRPYQQVRSRGAGRCSSGRQSSR